MGKTVESYRMALEDEINRWGGFAKALRTEDKEALKRLWMIVETLLQREATPPNPYCLNLWLCRFLYLSKRSC